MLWSRSWYFFLNWWALLPRGLHSYMLYMFFTVICLLLLQQTQLTLASPWNVAQLMATSYVCIIQTTWHKMLNDTSLSLPRGKRWRVLFSARTASFIWRRLPAEHRPLLPTHAISNCAPELKLCSRHAQEMSADLRFSGLLGIGGFGETYFLMACRICFIIPSHLCYCFNLFPRMWVLEINWR